jgi:hypothetical protein
MTVKGTVVAIIALALLIVGTAAVAAPRATAESAAGAEAAGGDVVDMEAMHASEEMRELHAQLPPELAAACDAMHAAMGAGMGGTMRDHAPVMGGTMRDHAPGMGGMPRGAPTTSPGGHASHHGPAR